MGSDDLCADVVLEKAGDVLVVLVPLLEPKVELGGDNGIETSEFQRKVGWDGRRGRQGQEGGNVGSDLEGNLHDRRRSDGRRVGRGGGKSGGERLGRLSGSGIRRVDGDGGNLGNGREGVEGRDGHGGKGGDSSCSQLTSKRWGKESGGTRAELGTIEDGTAPAGRAPSLPTCFSDGAESGDGNVTILTDGHLCELLREGDHGSERFRERGAGQEDIPSSLEESQLVDLGEAGEEEGETRTGRRRDELYRDERVRRKSDDQGGFNGGQVDPEAVNLHKIVGGRHCEWVR